MLKSWEWPGGKVRGEARDSHFFKYPHTRTCMHMQRNLISSDEHFVRRTSYSEKEGIEKNKHTGEFAIFVMQQNHIRDEMRNGSLPDKITW